MSASRTLLRGIDRNPKKTILKKGARFRRVLGVSSMLAETGDGVHRHAYRYHATKGNLTWRVPLWWKWRGV